MLKILLITLLLFSGMLADVLLHDSWKLLPESGVISFRNKQADLKYKVTPATDGYLTLVSSSYYCRATVLTEDGRALGKTSTHTPNIKVEVDRGKSYLILTEYNIRCPNINVYFFEDYTDPVTYLQDGTMIYYNRYDGLHPINDHPVKYRKKHLPSNEYADKDNKNRPDKDTRKRHDKNHERRVVKVGRPDPEPE